MKDTHAYSSMPIDELYAWFAGEAAPTSPTWGRLCRFIAGRPDLAALLDQLPGRKRQPNLFLGAIRYLDGPTDPGDDFVDWARGHWSEITAVIAARATQTNEPGRCAVLAPLLASLGQPIALFEVGASAGLCLLPDRYAYRYDGGPTIGDGSPVLECATTGTAPATPADLRIVARAGLDLNPLDAGDADDARWLRALVWPGETVREERLSAALEVAAADPPTVLKGSALEDLDRLLARTPDGATPVVMHSVVLAYLARDERDAFVEAVRASGAHWLSFEGSTVVTSLRDLVAAPERPHFLVALDGEPVAFASPHGSWVDWL